MNSVTLFEISSENVLSAISPGGASPPPYPPGRNMKKTATKVVASLFAFSLIAAACGGSDDAADAPAEDSTEEATSEEASSDEIVEISVTGSVRSVEGAGAIQQVLGARGDANPLRAILG